MKRAAPVHAAWAVASLALWAGCAYAVGTCYVYFNGTINAGQEFPSSAAMYSAAAAQYNASAGSFPYGVGTNYESIKSWSSSGCSFIGTSTGGSGNPCELHYTNVAHGTGACYPAGGVDCGVDHTQSLAVAWTVAATCPDRSCDAEAPGAGEQFTTSNVPGPNEYCNVVSGCKMVVQSRAGDTATVKHTLSNCSVANDPGDPADPQSGDPETCTAVGSGEYCASATGDGQCGYFNDTYVCLAKVKSNECKALGDGGRVCASTASSTPPVPDNGTAGVPATPDGTLSQTAVPLSGSPVTTTLNYFSSSTVAGSLRDPGTTGAAPNGGSPGSEGDSEEEEEEGSGECEGDGCTASVPELEEIGTLSEAMGGFWEDLQEVPIVAAAADIAPSFGAGSCPDWTTTVQLYSASIEIDFTSICSIWTSISGALGAVCLVAFGLLAFRILFSA